MKHGESMLKKQTILLMLVITIVVVVMIANKDRNTTTVKNAEYVRAALINYISKGVVNSEVFPNDLNFTVHPEAYAYATNNADEELRNIFKQMDSETEDKFRTLNGMNYIKFIAEMFVIDTPFQGKVNINAAPMEDAINIYFLDSDKDGLSSHFEDNCAFIGHYHAIICDANFIKRTINDLNKIQKTYDIVLYTPDGPVDLEKDRKSQRMIVDRLKGNVVTWILGHEIGHAVLHYDSVVKAGEQLHFDLTYNQKEEEADIFVAKKIVLSEGRASEFKTVLGEFIHQEYRKQYRETHPVSSNKENIEIESRDFPLHSKIEINQSKFRVPLLLRSLHIIDALLKIAPAHDETGYFSAIEKNIEIEKSIL